MLLPSSTPVGVTRNIPFIACVLVYTVFFHIAYNVISSVPAMKISPGLHSAILASAAVAQPRKVYPSLVGMFDETVRFSQQ